MVSRSRPTAGRGYLGEFPPTFWDVLERAWIDPFYISSNFAREHSIETALAASMGWIGNITPDGHGFTRQWHITLEGLVVLQNVQQGTSK